LNTLGRPGLVPRLLLWAALALPLLASDQAKAGEMPSAASPSPAASSAASAPAPGAPAPGQPKKPKKGKHKQQRLVAGYAIGLRAKLAGAKLAHQDLRWADLRYADLERADLVGADLTGADLSHANLKWADLTGAKLEGARVHEASVLLSVGGDFSLASVHPFFSEDEREAVGSIRFYTVAKAKARPGQVPFDKIHHLAAGANGNLYWLQGQQFHHMDRTGYNDARVEISKNISSMTKDINNRLWLFSPQAISVLDLGQWRLGDNGAQGIISQKIAAAWLPRPPQAAIGTTHDSMLLFLPGRIFSVQSTADDFSWKELIFNPPINFGGAISDQRMEMVYGFDENGVRLMRLRLADQDLDWKALGLDHPITSLAVGEDDRLFYLKNSESYIGTYAFGEPKGAPRLALPEGTDPYRMVIGPDGNLWVTAPRANLILRVSPSGGEVERFPLPKGTHPTEILDYRDGRLLFTTERGDRIGSIRAVASEGKVWEELPFPALAADGASNSSSADPVGASLARAQERHNARMLVPEEEKEEKEEEQEAVAAEDDNPAVDALAEAETKPRASMEAASSMEQRPAELAEPLAPPSYLSSAARLLRGQRVNLTRSVLRHIRAEHLLVTEKTRTKTHFLPRFESEDALAALIAQGLALAGTDAIGRVKQSNHAGKTYTICTCPQVVGTYWHYGQNVKTKMFMVVTRSYFDGPGRPTVHDLVTAYPISPNY
jgi:hypothetical protein